MQEQGPYYMMDMPYNRGKNSPPGELPRPGSGRLKLPGGMSTDDKVGGMARCGHLMPLVAAGVPHSGGLPCLMLAHSATSMAAALRACTPSKHGFMSRVSLRSWYWK